MREQDENRFEEEVHERIIVNMQKSHYKANHPMYQLLCQQSESGYIAPVHHQQWQTFNKAIKLGLITNNFPAQITPAGWDFLKAPLEL